MNNNENEKEREKKTQLISSLEFYQLILWKKQQKKLFV